MHTLSLFSCCSHCLGPLSDQGVGDGSWLENETEKESGRGKEAGEAKVSSKLSRRGKEHFERQEKSME